LLIPLDNLKVLNFLNFNDLGANALVEMNAFKKIKNFSKIPNFDLINSESNFNSKFNMLSRCYFNENIFSDAHLYGLKRQHNFVSNKFINKTKILEKNSFNKFLNFSLNFNYDKETSSFYFNHDFKK
jgi:hypothetical protein